MPPDDPAAGTDESHALRSLRKRSLVWLFIGWVMVVCNILLLMTEVPSGQQWALIVVPASGMLAFWMFLYTHLHTNRRVRDRRLLPRFGLGNAISIFRGLEVILLAGYLFIPRPQNWTAWIPALLYTSADILDYLDGYAARVRNEVTQLGEELDQLFDGAGLLIASLLAIRYGALPWWLLPFGAARYLFLFGLWIRRKRGLAVFPLSESRIRRPIAGLTMGFMTAMLWPIVQPPASLIAGLIFMLPFGASFLRDWFVVSGVIDPQSVRYLELRDWLEKLLIRYFPVGLRLGLAVLLGVDVWITMRDLDTQVALFNAAGFPAPQVIVLLFTILKLVALPFLVMGAAGRFAAFLLIFPIGLASVSVGLNGVRTGLLIADLLILILGTGMYSVWEPSRKIFGRRPGGTDE
ncbi:MAG: CDP-alcohol phosphatidyltransferase family protein [Anaerolineales bacterium]|jgi:CDP-diacylglycerol--glycerol-3-phosphate 3-phosphatidyltransferase